MKPVSEIRRNEDGFSCLYVDKAPFLILGGEIHNSSSSNAAYMKEKVWPYIRGLNLNTVLLSVAWETIESEENVYDFSLVQELLEQAVQEKIRLVVLWFGLWKNGESYYAPEWVKKDRKRFFRAKYRNQMDSETISPLCHEAVEKDKKAFCKLMAYIKENDREHRIIMVQVENEVGFLGADRDYSAHANEMFCQEIPASLQELYQKTGTWEEAFGPDAAEYFMAWNYARGINVIAEAGKKIYNLPMYANAWIEQHPRRAGVYPSGGPVARLLPLWQTAAPSLDMISPDVYVPDFQGECISYTQNGNPLFIPEAARNVRSASRVFYAVGAHHALGFSPFGIEDIQLEDKKTMTYEQLAELNIMAEAFDDRNTAPYLRESYRLLQNMKDKIFGKDAPHMTGFIQRHPYEQGCILELGLFDLQLDYLRGETGSAGIVLWEGDEVYLIGCNTRFRVLPAKGSKASVTVLKYEEGEFIAGEWRRMRVLNGDERYDFSVYDMPQARYMKICVEVLD